MLLLAYFSSSGSPATGLTPTITVRDVSDGSAVVNAQAMTETGSGFYKYDYAGYDTTKNYVILCAGGITLVGTERYAVADSGDSGYISDVKTKIDTNLDAAISTRTKPADTQARVTLVDTCTVNTDMRGTNGALTDKAGFSLSATGADLILKSSTFIQAVVAALNELATYGLTALNTLLVTTGIKAATIPIPADSTGVTEILTRIPDATAGTAGGLPIVAVDGLKLASTVDLTAGQSITASNMRGTDGAITSLSGIATATNVTDAVSALETYGDGHWAEQGGLTKEAIRQEIDTNSTQLAAIKLKTDTLAGPGGISWSYTLTDSVSGLPIPGADIWVTSDLAGANVLSSGVTNDSGMVTFFLNAGTVYVWRRRNGYTFTQPDAEVVS